MIGVELAENERQSAWALPGNISGTMSCAHLMCAFIISFIHNVWGLGNFCDLWSTTKLASLARKATVAQISAVVCKMGSFAPGVQEKY